MSETNSIEKNLEEMWTRLGQPVLVSTRPAGQIMTAARGLLDERVADLTRAVRLLIEWTAFPKANKEKDDPPPLIITVKVPKKWIPHLRERFDYPAGEAPLRVYMGVTDYLHIVPEEDFP